MRGNSFDGSLDDDDLRSLLSGNSGGGSRIAPNPHKKLQQQKQQQQQEQQQRQQQQQQLGQGLEGDVHITNLPLSFEEDIQNSPIMRSNSNGSGGGSSGGNHNPNYKKTLWILGTIILAMGFLGPSGLLWDFIEDGESSDDDAQEGGHFALALGGGFHHGDHGDRHHHLSPPPPHSYGEKAQNVHPMVHSAQGIERATSAANRGKNNGYPRHGKFGTRKKKLAANERNKKNKNRKKINKYGQAGGGGGWGIREAVDNIDKVFLSNRPEPRRGGDDFFVTDDTIEDESMVPVVHYADDGSDPESARIDANADALDTYTNTMLPASDALECRASVVAFVINATDVRDECDGLRKAFDRTCSVVHQGENAAAGGGSGAGGVGQHQPKQHEQRRRRLSEWGRPRLANLIPEAFRREMEKRVGGRMTQFRKGRRLDDHHNASQNRTLQEVSPASSGHGHNKHHTRGRGNYPTRSDDGHHHHPKRSSVNEQRRTDEVVQEENPVHKQQQKQEQAHSAPLISLNIPTADKHLSEEMLQDALLLQESSDPMQAKGTSATSEDGRPAHQQSAQQTHHVHEAAVPPDYPRQPFHDVVPQIDGGPPQQVVSNANMTAASAEAVQDAAESAFAIRTAVDTVKNSMSDPKSVEARTCCASILSVFHEHCDPTTTGVEDYSDRRLLVVVFVITVCGMVKSLIRHLGIRWLPEAGGCILVGVFGYLILEHLPHVQFAFDGDMFLRIMVPPIVFEAAVKINKQSFRRHVLPICIFAVAGTLASTAFTAFLLHKGSSALSHVTTIPPRESLIFGALISSIDPIAVLSVLNNMGMSDKDTIYVLIFGESLLNDGVAIVLFQTLVHFLDESLVVDSEVVSDAFVHFAVVALGSVAVGTLAGACATIYFSMMHGCQTPMVEVIMFCCWSFMPYYVCDMVEWSGIVAIVANGFVMDLYVIGQKKGGGGGGGSNASNVDDEIDFLVNGSPSGGINGRARPGRRPLCRTTFDYSGHLSPKADSHVHFVIEIFATLMETAIFAYLGLFLFSPRYHWSGYLTLISIFATVAGRIIMIPLFSQIANICNSMGQSRRLSGGGGGNEAAGVHIDRRMQLVLVFAGLRGAMSFALVEHIPMFDTTTGQGSRLKPELKAMTSASVIFTVFVLGGATSYLMDRLGYSIGKQQQQHNDTLEIVPLVHQRKSPAAAKRSNGLLSSLNDPTSLRSNGSVRQRGPR